MSRRILGIVLLLGLFSPGCQSLYNTTMEKVFGYEKRHLLTKSVETLRKDQQKAQEEFKDAITQIKELYGFEGGKLEATYNRLKSAYEDAQSQAEVVGKRIENMEGIAKSMFSEWEREIKQFTNPTFAADSKRQLAETKTRYAQLSKSVRASEQSMQPVLKQLNDYVLYLKHNLNAASIGSLKGEAGSIQTQIEQLIQRMNDSIAEADAFIQSMPKE
ncbi:MAG TPA: DUF2959 family protein [Candidatus Omnitrophota bacterium]|nr:DUF2959 domain-containing protein [Candidatus Omnitrophota bacterium]HPB68172.1 DUF2959 family protein [Candidatus Omnitrophota bacterium]HQO57736.1 DUF2959 family protein [Candidatus Omnitrophota bacterium]HQP11934.1 DUF2959 family protein [Candidatus Omnitrophota bacterium]